MELFNQCRWFAKKAINFVCFLTILPCYLRQKKTIQKDKINKILLINLQGIGDIVMTTPFLTALRKELPGAEIEYLCYKGNGDLLEGDKRISRIIKRKEDNLFSIDFLATLIMIRQNNYDLCINLFPAQHSALLAVLSNARYKLGNLYGIASTGNNLRIKRGEKTWDMRKSCKNIAEQLKIGEYGHGQADLSIQISEETKKQTEVILKKEGIRQRCIAINPNAIWVSKNWPVEYWCTVIESLLKEKKYMAYQIVLFGGPADKEQTRRIKQEMEKRVPVEARRVINLAGKLSLKQTAATLKEMKVFITTDSGLLHIAIAVNTKTIALFGCTNPEILVSGARNVEVVSVYDQCPEKFKFNHNNEPPDWKQECMRKITVDEVLGKIRKMLQ